LNNNNKDYNNKDNNNYNNNNNNNKINYDNNNKNKKIRVIFSVDGGDKRAAVDEVAVADSVVKLLENKCSPRTDEVAVICIY